MRLQHYFFYFPKAISKPICNKIIKRCKSKEFSKGTVVEMSFSKSDLAKIKNKILLSTEIEKKTRIIKKGKDYWCRCPFHKEKTLSFRIDDDRGSYYCFGCGAKGDIFSLYTDLYNYSFIEAVSKLAKREGIILNKKKKFTGEKDYNSRKSSVHFFTEQWVYDLIDPYIATANRKAGWNFDYNFHEAMQFTQYKKGQFYDWHVDQHHLPYEKHASNYDGKVRKLSLTLNLSDPKSYEGGDFMFDYRDKPEDSSNIQTCTILKEQGTIVVFPSFVFHKVSPVTKGTRHSLVNWTIGAPWK